LRVLVVASTYPALPGDGTPAFVRDLALGLGNVADVQVLVPATSTVAGRSTDGPLQVRRFRFYPRRWQDLAEGAILENLRARPSRWLQVPPFFIAEMVAIRREIRRFRPDVVHLHWLVPQGVAALAAGRSYPTLVTTLGGDLYALEGWLPRLLKRVVVRRAAALTAMNEDMRRRLLELGADPQRTHVMPMGADVDGVRSATVGARGLPGRLVFVGRLVEKKGVAVLLDAVRRLPSDVPWSLDVVGDGPLRESLEQTASGLPVRFLGQLPKVEVARAFGRAEVLVFPSVRAASGDQDGLPVALVEGMAVGRAVVVTDLPGLADAVRQGADGLVVPPGDPAALASALECLLRDDEERRRLGAAAAARADDYRITVVSATYGQLLMDVAAGNHRRGGD
jgi:glycosyltransferase involved in cell wall biosynthesis